MLAPATPAHVVSRAAIEARLAELAADADPIAGVFGPDTMMWTVSRESALLLGGGRAALLQVAHPFVAHAVMKHSSVFTDVRKRFYRTMEFTFGMAFGDARRALASARAVHNIHQKVSGTLTEPTGRWPAGTRYHANDADALLWVAATLQDTARQIFELLIRPLTAHERARYHGDFQRWCGLFGICPNIIPPDWQAFDRYVADMLASDVLGVGGPGRQICAHITTAPRPASAPLFAWGRMFTTGLLPARFRAEFGLRYGRIERAGFAASRRILRASIAQLPAGIRYNPAYLYAVQRLAGDTRPHRAADAMAALVLSALGAKQ